MLNPKIFMHQIIIAALLLIIAACSCRDSSDRFRSLQQWMTPNGKLKVLSTTSMINDIVRQVGGDHVDGLALVIGELDPHSYQLVKGDDEKLAFSDLIFYNGLGLEHGPSLQSYLLKQPKAISLGDAIRRANPSVILDYKGQIDPHIWMDISLWAKTIPHIVAALSSKDPAHAEDYRTNGTKLLYEMDQAHKEVKAELQQIPSLKRYLVTSHDAFNYFTRSYLASEGESEDAWHARFAAPEGLAPDSQLSATDIQAIVDHLRRYHIRVLFPESNISRDSIRKIVQSASDKGMKVEIATDYLYADAMGKPDSDADTYLKMIRHNATVIAKYLKFNGDGS